MLIVRMLGSSYHNFQGSRLACYRLMYANFKGHPIWGEQTSYILLKKGFHPIWGLNTLYMLLKIGMCIVYFSYVLFYSRINVIVVL